MSKIAAIETNASSALLANPTAPKPRVCKLLKRREADTYSGGGSAEAKSASPTSAVKATKLPGVDKRIIAAVNDLGFKLYAHASKAGESYFVSSTSIAYALAMLTNGAEGDQAKAMLKSLGLSGMEMSKVNAGFKALTAALLAKYEGIESKLANGIWASPEIKPSKAFTKAVTKDFKAALEVGDMKLAYKSINAMVSKATNGMIKDPVKPGVLDECIMALVNAIYFKGSWKDEFDTKKTKDEPFHLAGSKKVDVPMMSRRNARVPAKAAGDFQAVRLPYGKDGSHSMVVIVPSGEGSPAKVMAELATSKGKTKYLTDYADARGDVSLPRFEISYESDLTGPLKKLGVPISGKFTAIDPEATVGFVKHMAKVKVNEKGTEAAAVTIVGVTKTSVQRPKVLLKADRPFVFLVVHEATQAVTFTGTYEGPKG